MIDGEKRLKEYEEQKRLHSCKHCGNFQCEKYKAYKDLDKYLRILGSDELVDDLKSLMGSECQVFVYNLDQSDKRNSSTFGEVSEKLLHKYDR